MNPIQKRVSEGYELNTFLLYQNIFSSFRSTFLLISMILLMGLGLLFLLSVFGTIIYYGDPIKASKALQEFDPTNLTNEFILWSSISNVIIFGILGVLSAGFLNMIREVYYGRGTTFGTIFQFFIKWDGLKVFIFSFFLQLFITFFGILLQQYGLDLVQLFLMVLGHTLTILVIPFIIFHKLSIWNALKYSTQLVNQYSFRILALVLFYGLLSYAGLFIFIVGVLFTLPIQFAFKYHLYHQIIYQDAK